MKKQETINLVVIPANVDIATTEALKMAKTVDPDGQRTLGNVVFLTFTLFLSHTGTFCVNDYQHIRECGMIFFDTCESQLCQESSN